MSVDADTYVLLAGEGMSSNELETEYLCCSTRDFHKIYVCVFCACANPCILHTGDIYIFASFNRKVL
jgi:hypothetical protein